MNTNTPRWQQDRPEPPDAEHYARRVANLVWVTLDPSWNVMVVNCPACQGFLVIVSQPVDETMPWAFHMVKPGPTTISAQECASRIVNTIRAAKTS